MSMMMAPKKPTDVRPVVDIRDGWKFAFEGSTIRRAISDRIGLIEDEVVSLIGTLERDVGESASAFVAFLLADRSGHANAKAVYLASLADRVVVLQEERDKLVRALKGLSDTLTYILAIEDMEHLGL